MSDEEEAGGVAWSEFIAGVFVDSLDWVSDDVRSVSHHSGEWIALMSPAVRRKYKQLRKQIRYGKRKNRNL